MPWEECSRMDERLKFIGRYLDGERMTDLCREFGISRKTGYKIYDRYQECGLEALVDRSRRPVRYGNHLPFQVETVIVSIKKQKPHWGARKIRDRLIRRFPNVKTPARSTIHAVLDRHGLVKRRAEAPASFVPELILHPGQMVVVLDDEPSIHQIWETRLNEIAHPNTLNVVHLTSGQEMIEWYKTGSSLAGRITYLFDFELLGEEITGLDLIARFRLHEKAILVTSYYEDEKIRAQCARNGIKMIPKALVPYVPIRLSEVTFDLIREEDRPALRAGTSY